MTTVIAHQLPPEAAERLLATLPAPLRDGLRLTGFDQDPELSVPPEAVALLLRGGAFRINRQTPRPAGWPGALRWLQLPSAGIDRYPPWLLQEVGTVTTMRGAQAVAIAEWVMAQILVAEKRVETTRVRSAAEWRARKTDMGTVSGRVLGLVGLGAIGTAIAARARAFGMRILAVRNSDRPGPAGVELATLDRALAEADHLCLCAPLTDATRHLIDARALARVKPGLHLINVGRGALVATEDLRPALDDGRLSRASLDVTDPEPPPEGHWLYDHPQVRLTPHISWLGPETVAESERIVSHNLRCFLQGDRSGMLNVLDLSRGY